MSLSKYFEKSDAFQPEEMVKGADNKTERWTPSAPQESASFVAEKKVTSPPRQNVRKPQETTPTETTDRQEDPSTTAGQKSPTSPNKPEPKVPPPKDPPAPPPPPKQEPVVDLEKYMDRKQAEKAIDEAYQRGCEDGRHKLDQDFNDATSMLIAASQQLETIRETLIANSAREIQEFALAIAEKILRISVVEQDQTLIATIDEALHRAVKSDEFTVYVNPDDYDIAVAKAPSIVTGISGLNNLVIKKEATIERGGAKLESDNCTIDASIVSQFDIIREEVKKRLT